MLMHLSEGTQPVREYELHAQRMLDYGEGLRLRLLKSLGGKRDEPAPKGEQREDVLRVIGFIEKHQAQLRAWVAAVSAERAEMVPPSHTQASH